MVKVVASCINTQLRNVHTNARENITRTRAKWKASYFRGPFCIKKHKFLSFVYIIIANAKEDRVKE